MLNDLQVLRLGLELLVDVLARTAHGVYRHTLGLHLLSELASGCTNKSVTLQHIYSSYYQVLTIVAAEEKDVDKLQTKDAQKVPTNTGHPSGVHILGLHARLEHALELDGDWKRQFHYCPHG